MAPHLRDRPHFGKKPMKFYFRAQDIAVDLPGADIAGKLVLSWKRGVRNTVTEPFAVHEKLNNIDGSLTRTATTTQDLALICTMFKSRGGAFEAKSAFFSLKEETPEGKENRLGTVAIDLSSYATPELSADKVELSFLDGKIILSLTLTSHWLKSVGNGPPSEASSIGSAALSECSDFNEREELPVPPEWSNEISEGSGGGARGRSTSGGEAAGGGSGSGSGTASDERERSDAAREAAVERLWAEQDRKEAAVGETAKLRLEAGELNEQLARALGEVKYLKGRCERLTAENRVLRRDQRGGKRDEVVLQLETEIVQKEQERADMEESLSKAFGGALDEAHKQIRQMTAERDGLLFKLEEATHSRKAAFKLK